MNANPPGPHHVGVLIIGEGFSGLNAYHAVHARDLSAAAEKYATSA
jgi:hypothetical protein